MRKSGVNLSPLSRIFRPPNLNPSLNSRATLELNENRTIEESKKN